MNDETIGYAFKGTRISTRGWNLKDLLARGGNFYEIPTADVTSLHDLEIQKLIERHEKSGIPLLMTGFHRRPSWDSVMFSAEWLRDVEGASHTIVRNVYDRRDKETFILDYLRYAETAGRYAPADEAERLYAKDAPCPERWHAWMIENLPGYLLPFGTGDLSGYLSPENRAETLMTYLGVGDTYTPAHKDSCASVGQNIMVHTDEGASSFWFLTSTADSYRASMYWRDLGQELDHESHVATVDELARAGFPIYVCQQELGGLVIVPPQSCHQVLNSGGLTMKLAWSRMVADSFKLSLTQELRIYQRVCRPEIYRVKANVAAILSSCLFRLTQEEEKSKISENLSRISYFLPLYKQMLIESYDPHWEKHPTRVFDAESCDCCGADIWQSAMICYTCSSEADSTQGSGQLPLIICGSCYVDGRSCKCGEMQPAHARPFDELLGVANKAIVLLRSHQVDGGKSTAGELSEKDLISVIHPPVFRVATFLHCYRRATKGTSSRTCNLYRNKKNPMPGQHNHRIKLHEGLYCDGCHTRACWYHIVEKYGAHIVTTVTFSDAYQAMQRGPSLALSTGSFTSDKWHQHHKADTPSGDSSISFEEPWMDWLPRLARLFPASCPVNDSVLLGWYDRAHLSGDMNLPEALTLTQVNPSLKRRTLAASPISDSSFTLPRKRKIDPGRATKNPSPRKRRLVHYEEDSSQSSGDELTFPPSRAHTMRPSILEETRLQERPDIGRRKRMRK